MPSVEKILYHGFYHNISLNFPTIFLVFFPGFRAECVCTYKQRPFNFVVMNVGRRFFCCW